MEIEKFPNIFGMFKILKIFFLILVPNKPVEPEETGPSEQNTTQNETENFPAEIVQEQVHISEVCECLKIFKNKLLSRV